MPLHIVRNDITKMQVDAVVNAANTDLAMGGGVCGAIFQAAGAAPLQAACRQLSPIAVGEAVITPGFSLPARFIIHAAGPVYHPAHPQESARLLRCAYGSALRLALENHCESIAFPLISSGIYGYPKEAALQIAVASIKDFLMENEMDVFLVVFDPVSFAVSKALLGAVESYIDENYIRSHRPRRRDLLDAESCALGELAQSSAAARPAPSQGLDAWLSDLDEPFNAALLRLIDARGKTDAQIYKRANIDRKLFSKIRTGKGYRPGKRTILALAIALELSLEETDALLKKAGYALSHSQKFDVIVEFFIVNGKYDIFEINEVLFQYDQPLLGAY